MGRPLNNNLFGNPLNTSDNLPVLIFNTAIVNGQTLTNVFIEKQVKPTEFLISNGIISGIVDLVPNDPTSNGEACMKVITPTGQTIYAIKIYTNTIECSDGNTYYWNRFNYTNDDTITVNSMVSSQYKSAIGTSETGGKIIAIQSNINHQSFSENPASKNMLGIGGSGINATFDIISTNKSLFVVDKISLLNGGQNYKINDFISIPNVAKINVKSIESFPNYISEYKLNTKEQLFETDVSGTHSVSGGTGVNAQFTCKCDHTTGYEVSSVSIANGGTGYKKGDVITTPFGTLNIISVNESTFAITKLTISLPKTVFNQDPTAKNVAVIGGNGIGATIDITGSEVFSASTATIADGGTGYTVGDSLTIPNCGTAKIDTIDTGTKGITKISLTKSKTYYSDTDLSGTTISGSGGSGSGATFNLTTKEAPLYKYSTTNIISGGSGYKLDDTIFVSSIATITVTAVSSGGAIQTVTAKYDGIYYNIHNDLKSQTGTGGSGTGATFDILQTTDKNGYIVSDVTINTAGSNYTLSDTLTVTFGTISVTGLDNGTGAAKTISFTPDGSYHPTDMKGVNASTGGTGTGATFNIISKIGYSVTDIKINNGGKDYKISDNIQVQSYNTEAYTINLNISMTVASIEVGDYAVTNISLVNKLLEETNPAGNGVAITGGTGKGLTLNLSTTSMVGYKISTNSLSNKGFGFTVGDVLTIDSIGTLTVNKVESIFGIITGFYKYESTSTHYEDMANPNLVVSGGSGSGLTLAVTSTETKQYFISYIEINQSGNGYEVGDTLRIGTCGSVNVTEIE